MRAEWLEQRMKILERDNEAVTKHLLPFLTQIQHYRSASCLNSMVTFRLSYYSYQLYYTGKNYVAHDNVATVIYRLCSESMVVCRLFSTIANCITR